MPQIQLRDEQTGEHLSLFNIRLGRNGQTSPDQAEDDRFTDFQGNTWFINPLPSTNNYTLWTNHPGYNDIIDYELDTLTNVDLHNGQNIVIRLKPKQVKLAELRMVDEFYFNVYMDGLTNFLLYKRYLDGEAIEPLLKQMKELGFNCARVIGMVSSFSHWYPQEYGNRYYDEMPAFLDLCARYGIYILWVMFADTQIVMPDKNMRVDHFNRTRDALISRPNRVLSLVNEPRAHSNYVDPNEFDIHSLDDRIVYSLGSYGDEPVVTPTGDYYEYHTPRGNNSDNWSEYPKSVKDQNMADHPFRATGYHKMNGQMRRAVASDEPKKFGWDPVKNIMYANSTRLAEEMGAAALGTSCMRIYHSAYGVYSMLLENEALWCAEAWMRNRKVES